MKRMAWCLTVTKPGSRAAYSLGDRRGSVEEPDYGRVAARSWGRGGQRIPAAVFQLVSMASQELCHKRCVHHL